MADVADEVARLPRRQLQRTGFARFVEVVDVHPVRRGFQALALGFEVALHEGETPRTRLAHHVDVVARARHRHAELQGLHRTLLAKHAAEGFQVVGGGEVELLGLEGTGQRIGRQSQAGSD
ncbi:hypothetical protein FQZ97_972830 [compost metagenome]